MGSATKIAIFRASSSFTHTLTYKFGSSTGTITTKTTSTSVSWTPAVSLANQIPKAVSGSCTITCDTYSGSTKVGSKTCTLTVPATVKPTISSLGVTRVDGTVPTDWGIYVQSKSKATLTINGATGSYGSTISSYSISGGGFSSTESSFTTGFLTTSGTITFTAKVTDSRGRVSDAKTVSISVVAYAAPSFTDYLSQRAISDGTANDDGTYALLQKTYTVDVLTKKRVANNGIVPQCYVENNHEAIIPRQLFMQVQEELQRRAHLRTENGKTKRVYSSKYALSSIIYCGKCGDLFRRVAWKARGASYNKWRCASRIEKGPKNGCDAEAISESEIQKAVMRAINKTLGGREEFLVQLQHNIEDVLNGDSTATLEYIDQRMAELQEKLVMCVNKNAEYDAIAKEIDALREKKAAVVTKDAEQEMLRKRINEMRHFLQMQTSRITEYDEQLVRRLIEKITVYDDKLIFEFKSGMTIELKR